MYLCQQSVEKAFKSVLLRLQERAGLKLGENNLRSLGHTLYHELHRLYRDNVSVIELPRLPHEYEKLMGRNVAEQAAARELEAFEKLSASWGNKEDKKIKRLAWSHSVGIRLEDDDLEDLNSFHTTALGPIYASVFGEAHRPVSLKNEKGHRLCTPGYWKTSSPRPTIKDTLRGGTTPQCTLRSVSPTGG